MIHLIHFSKSISVSSKFGVYNSCACSKNLTINKSYCFDSTFEEDDLNISHIYGDFYSRVWTIKITNMEIRDILE